MSPFRLYRKRSSLYERTAAAERLVASPESLLTQRELLEAVQASGVSEGQLERFMAFLGAGVSHDQLQFDDAAFGDKHAVARKVGELRAGVAEDIEHLRRLSS